MKKDVLVVAALIALLAVALAGTPDVGAKTPFHWEHRFYTAGDSINGADTLYSNSVSVGTDGFWMWVDLDSAGSATSTLDTLIFKLQTRANPADSWTWASYSSGVKCLGNQGTIGFPFLKYFPPDTMNVYGIVENIRLAAYAGPKDADSDSTAESGTSGASALVLKIRYGWSE